MVQVQTWMWSEELWVGWRGWGGSLQAYETEESTPNTELLDETQKVDLISSVVLIPPCSGDFPWILVTF